MDAAKQPGREPHRRHMKKILSPSSALYVLAAVLLVALFTRIGRADHPVLPSLLVTSDREHPGATIEYRAVDESKEIVLPAGKLFDEKTEGQLQEGTPEWEQMQAVCKLMVLNSSLGESGWIPTDSTFPDHSRTIFYRLWPKDRTSNGDEPPPYKVQYMAFHEGDFMKAVEKEWAEWLADAKAAGNLMEGEEDRVYFDVFMERFNKRFPPEDCWLPTSIVLPGNCHVFYNLVQREKAR